MQKFIAHKDSHENMQKKQAGYGKILRDLFLKSRRGKTIAAYQKMLEYANSASEKEKKNKSALFLLVMRIKRSTQLKLGEALSKLRQNNRLVDNKSQRKLESGRKLSAYIKLSSDNLLLLAFLRLRGWKNASQQSEKQRKEVLLGIFRKLQVA